MESKHFTVYREAPTEGIFGTGPGGFPCGIDCFLVLATDADLPSLIFLVSRTVPVI